MSMATWITELLFPFPVSPPRGEIIIDLPENPLNRRGLRSTVPVGSFGIDPGKRIKRRSTLGIVWER